MWSSRMFWVAFAAALVSACDRAPTEVPTPMAPNAAVIENGWYPMESDYVTCSGEVLAVVGQVHITQLESTNEAGKYQTRYQLNMKATATGADGSVYNVSNSTVQMTNDPPTDGMVVNWNIKVKLTGKGPAANESFYWLFRGTMNANGALTSFVNNWTGSC